MRCLFGVEATLLNETCVFSLQTTMVTKPLGNPQRAQGCSSELSVPTVWPFKFAGRQYNVLAIVRPFRLCKIQAWQRSVARSRSFCDIPTKTKSQWYSRSSNCSKYIGTITVLILCCVTCNGSGRFALLVASGGEQGRATPAIPLTKVDSSKWLGSYRYPSNQKGSSPALSLLDYKFPSPNKVAVNFDLCSNIKGRNLAGCPLLFLRRGISKSKGQIVLLRSHLFYPCADYRV